MDKTYSPRDIEQRLYARWEAEGFFRPSGHGAPYSIVIPPPNVTGTLHMGHAFQDTIMDALTRYHRMLGEDALWQPGTDHAGIATQMVVERQLNAEGKTRHDLGREAFVARVWRWKEESGGTIARQLRRLGASVDWSRDRFTMDEGLSAAVTETFVRLHEQGLIYRGKRLVNWDPVLHTALSDLEVLSQEEAGQLWHLRYPLADGSGSLTVATTRPETMLGDTAVAVHPEDERYRHLVGRMLRLPLAGRDIPIVADPFVDPAFGSGCVKITPAHDFNDYELGQRHGLPLLNILDANATLNDAVPAAYRGLDRFEARRRVVADLQALGLVDRIEPHTLMVPRGDRSNAVLEPWLTDQWYVRIEPLAGPAIAAVESGRIRFVPENWDRTYFEWMRNIKDWCISRQLWWGHRIPAWYAPDGSIYVGRSEAEVRTRHALPAGLALRQDEDVLDTWFSSALWPFSTLGWPAATPELARFYPTSVLVTGFDIIFFWVARMIMFGLKFMGEVPFREVYVHGLIRDAEGQKMSKSKGNVLDPLDLIDGIGLEALVAKRTGGLMQPHLAKGIEKATRKQFPEGIAPYGTDALRFTFASLATLSRDIRFDVGRIEGYRNFCNKLWNAARFVLLSVEGQELGPGEESPSLADRWILSRLEAALEAARAGFAAYRFDLASQALYEFTWYEFCDWYLELSKAVLQSETATGAERRATRRTLVGTLEALLRALHPLMPFITEEIWQRVGPLAGRDGPSVMLQPWPASEAARRQPAVESEMRWLMDFILAVRQIRGEMDIAPSRRFDVLLAGASAEDLARLARGRHFLERLANLGSLRPLAAAEPEPESAVALLGALRILVPMAGLIDVAAEAARLDKRIGKLRQDLGKTEAKLGNPSFVANAPAAVVEQERARVAEFRRELDGLEAQLARVRRLAGPPA
ncbi:MAG TPA: valine--tRNA ligase [Steroidobacteraceae bacterium]|nr:valine--tRNA ligase [Steroidobacteraceae bacterium]